MHMRRKGVKRMEEKFYVGERSEDWVRGVGIVANDCGMVPVDGMVCGEHMLCCS